MCCRNLGLLVLSHRLLAVLCYYLAHPIGTPRFSAHLFGIDAAHPRNIFRTMYAAM